MGIELPGIHHLNRVLLVMCLTSSVVLATSNTSQAQSVIESSTVLLSLEPPEVTNDEKLDAFVGTGGLILPPSFTGSISNRIAVANCLNCVWRYSVYCSQDSQVMCAHATATCPKSKVRYRVSFGKAGVPPVTIGSVCSNGSKPVTRQRLGQEIENRILRYLPILKMGLVPSSKTITRVPIVVWCNQKSVFHPPSFQIAGTRVQISAQASWRWSWGDGTFLWTRVCGSPYPSAELSHQYLRAGRFHVSVESNWVGEFVIQGVGKFPTIGPPITQIANSGIAVLAQSARLSH